MAGVPCDASSTQCCLPCEKELNVVLYLHQATGAKPNQKPLLVPDALDSFRTTVVHNWALVDAPDFSAKVIGRAQGIHVMADQDHLGWYTSFNIVFQDGSLKGSTLQVMGVISNVVTEGEWSIVGGTGELSIARGTIKYKEVLSSVATSQNIRELDVHAFYTPKSPPAVKGTVDVGDANA
ncbi:hypothetical protein ACQ4PT_036648 [Festuca glaucescens]